MTDKNEPQKASSQPGQKENLQHRADEGGINRNELHNNNAIPSAQGKQEDPNTDGNKDSTPSPDGANGTPVVAGIAAAGGNNIQMPSTPITSAAGGNDTPVPVQPHLLTEATLPISNQDFLAAIFGELLWPAVHVTGFACRPENTGVIEWAGQYAYLASEQGILERVDLNQYFTVSTFRPDGSGRSRRRKADLMAQFCLVIDDLGSGPGAKVPWELAAGKPGFSWVLETSPDNYQAGYIFTVPVSDADLLVRLVDAMIAQGLMSDRDPGMRGVTRYVRMPAGFNNKEKYSVIGADGVVAPPFQCRMVEWHPERKYSVEQIVTGWGLQLAAPGTSGAAIGAGAGAGRVAGSGGAGMLNSGEPGDNYDLIEAVLDEIGLRGRAQGNGFFGCPCPNEGEHTIKDGRTGYDPGQGFKCFHGSCEGLNRGDLKKWLSEEHTEAYERVVAARINDPAYAEFMFGPARELPTQVNVKTGAVEVIPARAVENTYPWFVARAEALSPSAGDNEAIKSLVMDAVVHISDPVDLKSLMREIDEVTGMGIGVLKDQFGAAKKALRADGKVLGGGIPIGGAVGLPVVAQVANGTVQPDVQGPVGVVSEQGTVLVGELPRLAVGDYMHVYPDTLPLADRIQVKPTTGNLVGLLEYARVGVFFNQMTKKIVVDDHGMYGFSGRDADSVKTHITDLMIRCGMSDARSKEMIRDIAITNQYHPVEAYLRDWTWDGTDRFQQVMNCVYAADRGHFEQVFRRWLISIMAAVYGYGKRPPRGVLTFVGDQYIGKTSFLKKLSPQVPGSFKEGIHLSLSGFNETDSVRKSTTALLVELGELDATFRKSDIAALKAFIGRDSDEYRMPYGTDFIEWPRQTVFAASVNHAEFLQDSTGNTRFWTVGVSSINLDAMSLVDNRQLWLQVKSWYDAGEAWTMTPEEMVQVEAVNAEHREIGFLEEEILSHFDWDDSVYQDGKPWTKESYDEHCRVYQNVPTNPADGEPSGPRVIQLTSREIARKIGQEGQYTKGYSKFNNDLKAAVRVLTKMPKPHMIKINKRKPVRVWYLPRCLDFNGNVSPGQVFK